uniref:lupus La protein n=1 Tax=Jaculus jaculus TaxID=51337 RepID=UPI001E1B1C60|nr:lupus La protein [Jaculus jaculus]XP_045003372.1 lupus La protein [Jaculus jaculus]XP_045003373.1 lupus La protein [Jaculus jaculus]XP_045003374.1 lupus La protein [Jaculus jaculus]XP_045003375.1 lupus La protein [Jaculus jaculus]XP_045003376.1 lupus La protein [Jaculus jaculus]
MAENGGNEKMAALEAKICHQIEYYFGDFNLPRDKFLKEQIKLDEGWVPLEIMIKFNRLNRLTTDFKVIVEALSKSKAKLMEISADKTKIRRSPSKPLPEVTDEYKNDVKNRSVYIKGFPTDATLDDIKEWLEDKGQILNIQMRRTLHKTFKGSIFAVFDSIHSAKKFVETRGQKYKGTDLLILFKDDYFAKKNEERKQNKVDAKLRARQDQEGRHKLGHAEMRSLEGKIGCLLKFSGDLDDQTCREDLHILFSNHGEIKWIDFVRGAKEGIILFKEKAKDALEKAKKANNGSLQLRNKKVSWKVLEGHVERDALKKIIEDQQESLSKWKAKGRRFKGKGKGNRGAHPGSAKGKVHFQGRRTRFDSDSDRGPMKRGRDDRDRGEPASKYQKTENGSRDK